MQRVAAPRRVDGVVGDGDARGAAGDAEADPAAAAVVEVAEGGEEGVEEGRVGQYLPAASVSLSFSFEWLGRGWSLPGHKAAADFGVVEGNWLVEERGVAGLEIGVELVVRWRRRNSQLRPLVEQRCGDFFQLLNCLSRGKPRAEPELRSVAVGCEEPVRIEVVVDGRGHVVDELLDGLPLRELILAMV